MNNKLLTIYIPTYNRSESLFKQLHAINASMDKEKVHVLVQDNESTDKHYVDVEQYCIEQGFIYTRNHFNIGADANILNGFLEFYRSEYLWILSDDDLLVENAVGNIVSILEDNSLDVLFLTHSRREALTLETWSQKDFYEHNIKTSDGAGLISNVIYNSSFIKSSIAEGFQNIYTSFAHLSILIHSFKNKSGHVGRVNAKKFFLPETNLPPAISSAYSKSYFGFVLLAELFEETLKKEFLGEWTSFWNLRHWHIKKKDQIAKQNCIYAKNYILTYGSIFDFFRLKLCLWYILTPLFLYAKKYKHKARN